VSQSFLGASGQRNESRCLAVAHGNGSGLVQDQSLHVARRFDRSSGHGEHVKPHHAIDGGDADGG
jgi:hypothetical protein